MSEFGNPKEEIMDLFAEMLGATFTNSEEYDPVTGMTTEWTKRDDGTYYARADTLQSDGLERLIRDDQEDGSRDNFITKKREDEPTVSVGYEYGAPNEPDQFKLKVISQNEEERTSFLSSYTPEGVLVNFQIEQQKQPSLAEEDTTDGFPEERLGEIVDLFRLKGLSAFDPATLTDLCGEIDLSGATPQLTLGSWLPKRGYTNEDIDAVMALASIPVDYHFGTTKALDGMSQNDADVIKEFLKAITASNLIPPMVHKDDRKLLYRYEDIDPSTIEGLDSLMGRYEFSLSSFLNEHNRSIKQSGEFMATFTPSEDAHKLLKFAIEQIGMQGWETLYEQPITSGESVRYERNAYQVDYAGNERILTIRDIFTPDKSICVVKFPLSFDAGALQEAIDSDDVETWRNGFDFIPFHFEGA